MLSLRVHFNIPNAEIYSCQRPNFFKEKKALFGLVNVVAASGDAEIRLVTVGGCPHNVFGGYPPYTHFFSVLAGDFFRPFQSEIERVFADLDPDGERSVISLLCDVVPRLWHSNKYRNICREGFGRHKVIYGAEVDSGGRIYPTFSAQILTCF